MLYAFARDGGVPMSETLKQVSPVYRTPGAAIWVGGILSIVATLYGGAFLVLSTGCAVFLYLSYLMPISAALKGEMGGEWTNKGPFNLKGASIPIAVLAILGCALLIFVGVQPPQEKVGYLIVLMILALAAFWFTMENKIGIGAIFAVLTVAAVFCFWSGMISIVLWRGSDFTGFWQSDEVNFALWAAVVVAVIIAALLLVLRGKRFAGPPIGDEIARRKAAIAAAEAAVGERA